MNEQLVAAVEGYVDSMQKLVSNAEELRQMEQAAGKGGLGMMVIAGGLVVTSELATQVADTIEEGVSIDSSTESEVIQNARDTANVTGDAAFGFGVVGVMALGCWGMSRFLRKKTEKIAYESTRNLRAASEQNRIIEQVFPFNAE